QSMLSDPKRMSAGYAKEQFYLRSDEEMKARFAEAPEAVQNTLKVAEKCNLEIEFGKLHFPIFHPPEHFTREGYLRHLLAESLQRRYGIQARVEGKEFVVESVEDAKHLPSPVPPLPADGTGEEATAAAVKMVMDRLQLEIAVIEKTDFISYFLIVGDFIRFGRNRGISCVARGSAAGSIVTY